MIRSIYKYLVYCCYLSVQISNLLLNYDNCSDFVLSQDPKVATDMTLVDRRTLRLYKGSKAWEKTYCDIKGFLMSNCHSSPPPGRTVGSLELGKVELYPLADESLGVRSMALGVKTPDAIILLDAGISLAPRRFGLPPHPQEFKAAREARQRIIEFAKHSDIVTVSHYHLDHYTPSFTSYYEWSGRDAFERTYSGKTVLVKKPDTDISYNQIRRASVLLRELKELGCKVVEADGTTVIHGRTVISTYCCSHGLGERIGDVLVFSIEFENRRIVYAPDVQGPMIEADAERIASLNPSLLVIGGPPLYLEGIKIDKESIEKGLDNLAMLTRVARVVVSHHILREINWRERVGQKGISTQSTYAEVIGVRELLLEAQRRKLYEEAPPSTVFFRWLSKLKRGELVPPPL